MKVYFSFHLMLTGASFCLGIFIFVFDFWIFYPLKILSCIYYSILMRRRRRTVAFRFRLHSLIQPLENMICLLLKIFLYDHFLLQYINILIIHDLYHIFSCNSFNSFYLQSLEFISFFSLFC